MDAATKRWIRNASDERAAAGGCRFDEARGAYTVWWIENYCRLYEGEWAGQPLVLRGCPSLDELVPIAKPWDAGGRDDSLLRAEAHCQCLAAGEASDWQYEVTMRIFGWVRWSEKWKRKVRRFRVASVWVPKKNKKSPTIAAYGLYLTCGDGEPGQKVFLAAKDGRQAGEIMGGHALEMVRQSPGLLAECTVNLNKLRITHERTRSYMQPLSSANSRSQEAKEGLNGSVVIDECHVVDRELVNRISRAGISRSEPIQIEASTAGKDPEGYGKEQWDCGHLVESGAKDDQAFFFACHAAPQNLSDEELAGDPEKFGRLANPAWGHTIDPEEFLADYRRSRLTPAAMREFKMYRLNVWQQAGCPWLRLDDWDRGKCDFTDEDLAGRACFGALDMSRTRDLTSFCLAFPEPHEATKFVWWHWLPEETAHGEADKAPWLDFAADPRCKLRLIPGAVIDIAYVRNAIRDLAARFDVQAIAYDDWNAEVITQELIEGVTDRATGAAVEAPLGVDRIAFSQGTKAFNEPTKEFERRVILGKIEHDGNPLLRWQAQHATLREDANGNIKPVKPKRDSVLKVDGLITAIMAFELARRMDGGSVYETRHVRFVEY